jgi:hypothetical protein
MDKDIKLTRWDLSYQKLQDEIDEMLIAYGIKHGKSCLCYAMQELSITLASRHIASITVMVPSESVGIALEEYVNFLMDQANAEIRFAQPNKDDKEI